MSGVKTSWNHKRKKIKFGESEKQQKEKIGLKKLNRKNKTNLPAQEQESKTTSNDFPEKIKPIGCSGIPPIKREAGQFVVALAGNPNVGKSTVFNALTGLNQHTGNWPGKTVTNAIGEYRYEGDKYVLVDVPGTYSLSAQSADEEAARDFVCFSDPDVCIIVVDATCLERNLNLVLQILEYTQHVVVCLNLMDEAQKKKIQVDAEKLSHLLGVQVVCTQARSGKGLDQLRQAVEAAAEKRFLSYFQPTQYDEQIENAVACIGKHLEKYPQTQKLGRRWTALRILEADEILQQRLCEYLNVDLSKDTALQTVAAHLRTEDLQDRVTETIFRRAEQIAHDCVRMDAQSDRKDRTADRILTSRATGIPVMLLLLCCIFWLTIVGANVPSEWLSDGLFWLGERLRDGLAALSSPGIVVQIVVDGIWRTLAWVVSVMLPPMAIFFPLFTLLEDVGYLPRVAFNLDRFFSRAGAHGKQALTMCMGFGCNACGVTGCRIIDSPRERKIAVLTNNFVPCNGRYPTLIAVITMFFSGVYAGVGGSVLSAVLLLGVIVLGVVMTLAVSKLLSVTILKGEPSSFSLELPPYRVPKVGSVIVRSVLDRTLFVLGRAAAVAAPAGLIIWLFANLDIGGASVLTHCTEFLDPFAQFFGMDGVILMAFILGFPANEIVFPIILMAYLSTGQIMEYDSLASLYTLLVENGWTICTALCVMLFSLFHFPCATTCWTIKKETGSTLWTVIAFILPTVVGLLVCACVNGVFALWGM